MPTPHFTPLVASLPATVPFVGPEAQERARMRPFRARIGANENVFGPSPKAIAAMAEAAGEGWKYGDPESHDLRQALAAKHGVNPENIVVGEGIDGLLGYLVRLIVEPGVTVVTSRGAYPTFNYHVAGYGGELHMVPYRDDREDPQALIDKAREVNASLVYIANPDNPMGTWHEARVLEEMIAALPEDVTRSPPGRLRCGRRGHSPGFSGQDGLTAKGSSRSSRSISPRAIKRASSRKDRRCTSSVLRRARNRMALAISRAFRSLSSRS